MKTFINPEVRKSSTGILILLLILMIILNIVMLRGFNDIKRDYIAGKSAAVYDLTKSHPELEAEVVEAIFKGYDEDEVKGGQKIVDKYGYSYDMNYKFFNIISSIYQKSIISVCLVVAGFGIVLLILNTIQYKVIYKRVRSLTKASKEILEGNYDINIYEEQEGEFAKLAYGFNNMRGVIQNQMFELQEEKNFLVNILSDISHQLKTPLAALIIYNDILSKKELSEADRNKFIDNSRKQLDRMEWLIKSLLKLAKVDARAIEFKIRPNNICETIDDALENLSAMAKENDVNFIFDNRENEAMVSYDEKWMTEAIMNIVKNGIEHTSGGTINVSVEETNINTKIIIRDNGSGISKKDLPNIFKRFYKSGNADSVGIGLSLSKSIVEAQNGYIEVQSEEGVGTEFKIILIRV